MDTEAIRARDKWFTNNPDSETEYAPLRRVDDTSDLPNKWRIQTAYDAVRDRTELIAEVDRLKDELSAIERELSTARHPDISLAGNVGLLHAGRAEAFAERDAALSELRRYAQAKVPERVTGIAHRINQKAKDIAFLRALNDTGTLSCLNIGENEDAAELLALVRGMAEEREWRPIATAPKDGTRILAHDPELGCHEVWWSGTEWASQDADTDAMYEPTHWLPLPAAPHE